MSVQFRCPACARLIFYHAGDENFQICQFCTGKIIVPSSVVHQQEALDSQPTERALESHKSFKIAEVQSVLNAGNKIEAIKVFKDSFGVGLEEAKQAVEMLEVGQRLPTGILANVDPTDAIPQQHIGGTVPDPGNETSRNGILLLWAAISVALLMAFIFLGRS